MLKRYIDITLEAAGKTLVLSGKGDYKILDIQGIEAADYEISFADNAQLAGSTVVGKRAGRRSISILFDIPDGNDFAVHRQKLIRFLRPDVTGSMTIDYNGLKRKIEYLVEKFGFENSNMYERLTARVDLICPQPFFASLDNYGKNIASLTPLFAFPLFIPRGSGRALSYKTMKQNVNLPNDGDVDTGIIIRFKATRGNVLNPCLEKVSTGEYMRILTEMKHGDVIEIDTNAGHKRIELNGQNAFNKIDRTSSFFSITTGDNILKYSADENYTNLDVNLYYTPKYLGV